MTSGELDAILRFQSLLHQGISLLNPVPPAVPVEERFKFQSLLHQGISLLDRRPARPPGGRRRFNPFFIRASVYWAAGASSSRKRASTVSIPSSSGHQFTVIPFSANGLRGLGEFQSLLHQGISLLPAFRPSSWRAATVSIPSSSGHQFTGLAILASNTAWAKVSIPSSSGHQFTESRDLSETSKRRLVSIPSSSGHQFTGCQLPCK